MVSYTWIPYFTAAVAFVMAYGIGANDVANAFATSVGAKAITLKTALLIASVMEFSGAFLMGSHVTGTISKGILDAEYFNDQPEVLMVAMMCALMAAAIWLLVATHFGLPVSTTHSIVGALVGCGLVARGAGAVNWKGVVEIVVSWFTSPVLSGIFSSILYYIVRTFILRAKNSFERALKFYPILVAVTFAVNILYIMYKGTPQLKLDETPYWLGITIAVIIGLAIGLVLYFVLVPRLRQKSLAIKDEEEVKASVTIPIANPNAKVEVEIPVETPVETPAKDVEKAESTTEEHPVRHSVKDDVAEKVQQLVQRDIHAELKDEESKVYQIHQKAEKFDARTENVFSYVQVITATFDSFCHGANDVANSIGPLAGVLAIYQSHGIPPTSEVPVWVLALGGVGIVLGLATLGYKIMASIGVNLVRVTPSRGFTIEMGAAIVVLIGSGLGMPLSTTHCQVGATVGVGCMEGKGGINWSLLGEVFVGWLVTLVVAGGVGAGVFFFAMGTPTLLPPF